MTGSWQDFFGVLKDYLNHFENLSPFLLALVVLAAGWMFAIAISSLVRRMLQRTDLDNRLVQWVVGDNTPAIEIEKWAAKGVYYLILLFVAIAFFQVLGFTSVTLPLNQMLVEIFTFAPRIFSAGLLFFTAWILAKIVRTVINKVLVAARVDDRLGESAGWQAGQLAIAESISNTLYWLVFLVFLPAILDTLGLDGVLAPIHAMLGKVLGFLPNIFSCGIILFIGWFAARIVQRIVTNVLAATGIDQAGERVGAGAIMGGQALSSLAGLILYTLVLVLAAAAALDALEFEAISGPVSQMLAIIFGALPAIFTAGLVLLVALLIGRFLARMVSELLRGMGFDSILSRLGIGREPSNGEITPSEIVGKLLQLAVLVFAAIEAANMIGFSGLASMLIDLTIFAGHVVLGIFIFGVGLFLANTVGGLVVERGGAQGPLFRILIRGAILVLTTAMALREMGLANEIINLAFGLLLGAIAIAIAIAFGFGSREIAAREVEKWLVSIRKDDSKE